MTPEQSPRVRMAEHRIIDVHHHFFPPFLQELSAQRRAAQRDSPEARSAREWTVSRSVEELDHNGMAVAILSIASRVGAEQPGPAGARVLARRCNEYATKLKYDHPGRFGLFAFIPMPDVAGALSEIEHALDVLRADGIGMMTSYGEKWPGDAQFLPVLEELDRREAVVYLHPLAPACCANLMPYVPASFAEYPHDTTRAILSLLCAGRLARFGRIRWIFSHAGGTIPMLAGRIRALALTQLDNLAEIAPHGIDHALRRLHFDTANSTSAPTMKALLAYMPAAQILFGTDFPYLSAQRNLEELEQLGLAADQLEAILRGNAARLLNLKGDSHA